MVNIDSSLCLEAPKVMKHAAEMKKVIAEILEISPSDVSIKATTGEKLGFVGREEGVVAFASVLLHSQEIRHFADHGTSDSSLRAG